MGGIKGALLPISRCLFLFWVYQWPSIRYIALQVILCGCVASLELRVDFTDRLASNRVKSSIRSMLLL